MKRVRSLPIIILTILSSFFSLAAYADESGPIVIRFSHVSNDGSPKGKGALLLQKLVKERLGDKVVIEVHGNSELFNDTDGLEALRRNEIQLMAPSLSKFRAYTDELQIFDLPFLFDDLAAVDKFQSRPKGRQLLLSMVKQGIVGLAYWHNGMKQLSANKPLTTPEEAAGLNFRIQNSDVLKAQFAAIKANSVVLPYSAMSKALADGQVQGAENPWANFDEQNLQSVQPYLTETNHGVLDYMLVTNSEFWYDIPFEIRSQLEGIIAEVTYQVNQTAAGETLRHRENIANSGKTEIISLSDEQRAAWRQSMQPVWQEFSDQIGKRLIRSAQAAN